MVKTKTKKTKSKKVAPFKERAQEVLKKDEQLYQKYGIGRKLIINYPHRKKAPIIGRIGIKLLQISGGTLDIQFNDLWKNNDK